MSKVYFFKIEKQSPKILEEAGNKIFKVFSDFFGRDDKVLIKVHFGENILVILLSMEIPSISYGAFFCEKFVLN